MNIENLKALVHGKELTAYQRALAVSEFNLLTKSIEVKEFHQSDNKECQKPLSMYIDIVSSYEKMKPKPTNVGCEKNRFQEIFNINPHKYLYSHGKAIRLCKKCGRKEKCTDYDGFTYTYEEV